MILYVKNLAFLTYGSLSLGLSHIFRATKGPAIFGPAARDARVIFHLTLQTPNRLFTLNESVRQNRPLAKFIPVFMT